MAKTGHDGDLFDDRLTGDDGNIYASVAVAKAVAKAEAKGEAKAKAKAKKAKKAEAKKAEAKKAEAKKAKAKAKARKAKARKAKAEGDDEPPEEYFGISAAGALDDVFRAEAIYDGISVEAEALYAASKANKGKSKAKGDDEPPEEYFGISAAGAMGSSSKARAAASKSKF